MASFRVVCDAWKQVQWISPILVCSIKTLYVTKIGQTDGPKEVSLPFRLMLIVNADDLSAQLARPQLDKAAGVSTATEYVIMIDAQVMQDPAHQCASQPLAGR